MTELQPKPILQTSFLDPPWAIPNGGRLPGTAPIEAQDWIRMDSAYTAQMALRDRLIATQGRHVHRLAPGAEEAARETLREALKILDMNAEFALMGDHVTRPDGQQIDLEWSQPLKTLGQLIQEDICILQQSGDEHVLTGAILCFPASWSLAEKFLRPLIGIHEPVAQYDDNVARRVQRLFDAIQPGRPIRRANCLEYADFALFQPRREDARRVKPGHRSRYIRTERQCLFKLPETKAAVFSIHTCVLARAALSPQDRTAAESYLMAQNAGVH